MTRGGHLLSQANSLGARQPCLLKAEPEVSAPSSIRVWMKHVETFKATDCNFKSAAPNKKMGLCSLCLNFFYFSFLFAVDSFLVYFYKSARLKGKQNKNPTTHPDTGLWRSSVLSCWCLPCLPHVDVGCPCTEVSSRSLKEGNEQGPFSPWCSPSVCPAHFPRTGNTSGGLLGRFGLWSFHSFFDSLDLICGILSPRILWVY